MILVPAYGRDYPTKKAVLEAFEAGKDFIIADYFSHDDGRLTNKEDLLKAKVATVNIRYKRKTQVAVVKLK